MELNDLIKSKMFNKNLTIKDLSNMSNVPYSTLQRFINGESDISSKRLLKILYSIDFDLIEELNKKTVDSEVNQMPYYIKKSLKNLFGG